MQSFLQKKEASNKSNTFSFFSKERNNTFFNSKSSFFAAQNNSFTSVQPKLTVNQPNDKYEQEADRMANAVVYNNTTPPVHQNIQRKCSECNEEEKQVQKKGESNAPDVSPSVSHSLENNSGNGNPLPTKTLTEMNSSFGSDFSGVRIHNDRESEYMNKAISARAFTLGNDIYFNSGEYDTNSNGGKHLLAHELTHTMQQQNSLHRIQRGPQTNVSIEDCLKQTTDLLPGKVGLVEHINREVALDEILGKERKNLEDQIWQDHKARQFVCEAGVSAMMALYYNRDFKNRLHVDSARTSFTNHPEFYSLTGFETIRQTKKLLERKYKIFIEPGDKEWNPEDIGLLAEALGKLTENEIPLISNYHFIRWTNRCNQLIAKNPDYNCSLDDYAMCGLHEPEIIHRKYTITMYDCMKGKDEEMTKLESNVQPGADTIIHEIGHAMEYGRLRLALEKHTDAKKEYERIKRQSDAATSADAKTSINEKLTTAKKAMDDADEKLNTILSSPVLDKFKKLIKGKKALTPYAATGIKEAFAEAFMLFKVAPQELKKLNKPLFDWFSKGGFI